MFPLNRRGSLNKPYVVEYVTENSSAVLKCNFKSVSSSITWILINKNKSLEQIAVGKTVNPGFENVKVVGNHTNGEYNLELQRVTKADEKIYTCVSNINKNLHEFEISVRLSTSNDEIKIMNVTESNAVVGVIGISLTLKCISEHQYLSIISWSTNDNILCENYGNESAFEFIPREEYQNAIYTCTAVHIGKEIRKSVRLNLIPKSSGTENNSIMKDINMVQEVQPGAGGNVHHNQNSSGLVYIEVDFEPKQEKNDPKLFYVHGSNNRSPYADINFSAKADPLPESESDDNEIEEDDFFTLEDIQGWAIEISE
ncbi:SPEG [Mytilus coruscus]|uniref:SPEG n=1 Tax=Mytilus coruscus TaxID=42192 RepID=A0A6J8CIN7_MYTCO|nr:SPEG [Mytilus coruscus]